MERSKIARECVIDVAKELGYLAFKPEQLDVAVAFIEGRAVFAILPTGFRKSLYYARLSVAFDKISKQEKGYSIGVVIAPFLAIMKDQVVPLPKVDCCVELVSGYS